MQNLTIKVNGKETDVIQVFEGEVYGKERIFVIKSKENDIIHYVKNDYLVNTCRHLKDLVAAILDPNHKTTVPTGFHITEQQAEEILAELS